MVALIVFLCIGIIVLVLSMKSNKETMGKNKWLSNNYPRMFRKIQTRIEKDNAYDVLHDVTERILCYQGEIDNYERFSNRIIHNCVADFYRRKAEENNMFLKEEPIDDFDVERVALGKEALTKLSDSINSVSNPLHRRVLKLVFIEEEDYKTVSDIENISYQSIRKVVSRFRKNKKKLLNASRR